MQQVNETMKLFNDFGAISQRFCQDCLRAATASLSDPRSGVEGAYLEQLRATRTAVDDILSLEHRCIEAWRSQLPADDALSSASRALLDATDTAIATRVELWHAWFASAQSVAPKGLMTPLPLPTGDVPRPAEETPAAPTPTAQPATASIPQATGDNQGTAGGSTAAR